MPNCTAYAYGRIYEITGEAPKITRGNAGAWYSINKNNGYYSYGQEPKLGAIAVWSGHVAVVEVTDGDTVTCSQSHWRSTYFDTVTFTSGENHFGQKFYGYIYACEDYFASLEEAEAEKNQTYKTESSQYKTINTTTSEHFAGASINTYQANDEEVLYNSPLLQQAIG